MRKLVFALALLATSPALASSETLAHDPRLLPTLYQWQQCMFDHIGNGSEDPYVRMDKAMTVDCLTENRSLAELVARHDAVTSANPIIDKAIDPVFKRYRESYISARALATGKYNDAKGRGCFTCGD